MPQLHYEGDVALLNLGSDENRFSPTWLTEMGQLLDEVEAPSGPAALVTVAEGKFWSNGLDLDWMIAHDDQADECLRTVQRLFARVLLLPIPTIAAIQGHAFAAGAMFTLAHDFQLMREDRGYWCLPEVQLGMPFTAGMTALLRARLPHRGAHEAMLTGRRYSGPEAVAAGLIDDAVDATKLTESAVEHAESRRSTAGATLGILKQQAYADVADVLRNGPAKLPRPGA